MDSFLLNHLIQGVVEAGCDEAGRGSLAGPVYAAAVILPPDFSHPLLNDSKKMTEKVRETLRVIIEKEAIAYGVAFATPAEIDCINILNASILSMHRALDMLHRSPEHILVDGNRFLKYGRVPHTCITGGDGKYASIAAASVLAKCYRDDYMRRLSEEFPGYGWNKNMAYPTTEHREAIKRLGMTIHHRKSFRTK